MQHEHSVPFQPSVSSDPDVDRLLLKYNNQPMRALCAALQDTAGAGLPMALIMDRRCGIERRAEDVPWYLVGATPLMLAIYSERLDVAKALLAAGANTNAKALDGCNPLILAINKGNLEAAETLIGYGADINAADENGNTPLHFAACCGYATLIELLERSGANLEAVDDKGCTPLHDAASTSEVDTIKALLKLGANQAAVAKDGGTPLHCAAAYHYASIENIEAFRYNVAAFEANLTAVDKNGRTPLQVYESRSRGSSDEVMALLTPNNIFTLHTV